MFERSEFQDLA